MMSANTIATIGKTLLACSTLSACAADSMDYELLQSDTSRVDEPVVSADLAGQVSSGGQRFALDLLWQAAGVDEGNVVVSPYSLQASLTMLRGGAGGSTESELASVLGQPDGTEVHAVLNQLDRDLAAVSHEIEGVTLHTATSAWVQKGFSVEESFLDLLATHYGSGVYVVDFGQSQAARSAINGWVADETEHRIQNLLPAGALSPDSAIALVQTVYLDAVWRHPFRPEDTSTATFNLDDDGTTQVQMMHGNLDVPYGETNGLQAIALPYGRVKSDLEMLLIRPKGDNRVQRLEAGAVQDLVERMRIHATETALPRFSFSTQLELTEALRALGVQAAFDPNLADLSGIGPGDFFISNVWTKTVVEVTEEGTVAAAGTSLVTGFIEAHQPASISFDRSFWFVVRHVPSGTFLFAGRVSNPSMED